jgi:replicative DNA helicase
MCKALIEEDQDIDEASIENSLSPEVRKVIENISPSGNVVDYILALKNSPHSQKNLDTNINAIKKASISRQLINTFDSLREEVASDTSTRSVGELVSYCEDKIVDLGVSNESIALNHQVAEGLREVLEARAKFPVEVPGVRTGFVMLDKELGGLKPGQLTVVIARPKIGKTSLLLNWAKYMAIDQGIPTLMLDTEMGTDEVNTRLVSMISGVEEKKLINGLFAKEEQEKALVEKALTTLESAPLFHIYMPEWDFETILAYARKFKVKHNIGAMFFDYIKLPDRTNLNNTQEYVHLGQLTTGLKNKIAGKLQIPVITAGQMNRVRLNDAVDTDQIAGSDRILHYANNVIALTKKTPEEFENSGRKSNLNLYILAARGAQSGAKFDILFKRPILRTIEVGGDIETNDNWDAY